MKNFTNSIGHELKRVSLEYSHLHGRIIGDSFPLRYDEELRLFKDYLVKRRNELVGR